MLTNPLILADIVRELKKDFFTAIFFFSTSQRSELRVECRNERENKKKMCDESLPKNKIRSSEYVEDLI
jgi:hypothetical protein